MGANILYLSRKWKRINQKIPPGSVVAKLANNIIHHEKAV